MQRVHGRLREALLVVEESLDDHRPGTTSGVRDLLLYCRGFCGALSGHHRAEDTTLFPELSARHPELRETLTKLAQDHSMIEYLLTGFERAARDSASAAELSRHLAGVSAVMETHFRYEERRLLGVLSALELDADPGEVFGPL
nr:hemerythrin domain-containing protein [Streptomyces spiramenti]